MTSLPAILGLFLALGFPSLLSAQETPPQKKYNLKTMTAEEVDQAATKEGHYDFDIAPDDGVIDAQGRAISAADLPAYLKENNFIPTAFYFLWITPRSMPLARLNMIDKLAAHGVTTIVVRHRPEAIADNRTSSAKPDDPARLARATALTPTQLEALRLELEGIHKTDQDTRLELQETEKIHGRDSAEMRAAWDRTRAIDAKNMARVATLLDDYGWLGPEQIGERANGALFLVVQHSNQSVQRHYLPLMRAAVKAGKARGRSLALLEDRVDIGDGQPQTYGSQIGRDNVTGKFFVLPLLDPDKVDERRASVGLPPMADYLKNWNLTWDTEAYKQELPGLMSRLVPRRPLPTPENK